MQENISLAPYTTFKIGGPARYFFEVKNGDDLREAAQFAEIKNLPIFILGGGSNILISDEGFPGVVILNSLEGIEIEDARGEAVVSVAAGEVWDNIVGFLVSKNLHGLENLSGIPGSVGAAPIQNIGAYGVEVAEFISAVRSFDAKTLKEKIFTKEECGFGYRESIFKRPENSHFIVTKIVFSLPKKFSPNISYRDLAEYFSKSKKKSTVQNIREGVLEIRHRKLPDVKKIGTAGSFFKNPIVTKEKARSLAQKFPDLPNWESPDGRQKISAAFLIDRVCGLKGLSEGGARVWQKQALVLVNDSNASAHDILVLSEKIARSVKEKTGIDLEREVRVIM